jgi:RND family efflux transporter MFP subunit
LKLANPFGKEWLRRASELNYKYWEIPKQKIQWPELPKILWPKITLPKITVTKITLPKISVPKWHLLKMADVKLPRLTLPKWKFLKYKIALPEVKLPCSWLKMLDTAFLVVALSIIGLAVLNVKSYLAENAQAKADETISAMTQLPEWGFEKAAEDIAPAAGEEQQQEQKSQRYPVEEPSLSVQAVLVPNANTVISSSRDGKIAKIGFDNGAVFKKGDVLVEYVCDDVKAEIEIARSEKELFEKKSFDSAKLFKLDLISEYDRLEAQTKGAQADARVGLYEKKMDDCYIRADYDGRVVKRLGNAGEYTRTDRVILEVASLDYLKAEFLVPSKWLRWVNVGAPIKIAINETGSEYDATLTGIYGEVDPVSQSIQMTAQLQPYEDPLLPGMSGQITFDVQAIRDAGVSGYLEAGVQR